MNQKEEQLLKIIINYVTTNNRMPTMRYLQKQMLFKSVNSITQYIKSLEKQNYLIRNNEGKLSINNMTKKYNTNLKTINIINCNNHFTHLLLDKSEKYIAFKIHNDYFKKNGIFRNDILIIKKSNKLKNNDLGLFIIDGKYRIMKYQYIDGFYILKDKEEILLHKVIIIGKVIIVEKTLS